MKIISYNVNGIRAAMRKGWLEWLVVQDADIVCVQELKATADQIDLAAIAELGYAPYCHGAEKKGYSGVAIFTKPTPLQVTAGCGLPVYDCEGRVLQAEYEKFILLNCYFPSGTSGESRQAVKMAFLEDFFTYVNTLQAKGKPLVIVGDYNIAHQEIDIHDPKGNKKTTGFLPEERAWMSRWLEAGLVDTYRHQHPTTVSYTWWNLRANARAQNKGWRIDYQCISAALLPHLEHADILPDACHSDHCPTVLTLRF